jgi:hypothetical protein
VAARTVSDSGVGKKIARRCVRGRRLEPRENSGREKGGERGDDTARVRVN